MDFKVDDDAKAPSAHQLAPSRKAGRQDWELQPTDGFSTPAELYLKAVPDDSSSDGGDGEDINGTGHTGPSEFCATSI